MLWVIKMKKDFYDANGNNVTPKVMRNAWAMITVSLSSMFGLFGFCVYVVF